jgi:acetyl esterase/lipase
MAIRTIRYGGAPGQVGDLSLPAGTVGPVPVVVLIHGGFWRARFGKAALAPLARALTAAGHVVWNIEYRRTGRGGGGGGVPETLTDVATAIDHLAVVEGLDPGPVVTCGHSAGGHLALWAAARDRLGPDAPGGPVQIPLAGAISLCGVVDLDGFLAAGDGNGAVTGFLGGSSADREARLTLAAPMRHLPLGIPQVLLHGLDDTVVPATLSEGYVALATAAGDDAEFIGLTGIGHREVIDPEASPFPVITASIDRLVGSAVAPHARPTG